MKLQFKKFHPVYFPWDEPKEINCDETNKLLKPPCAVRLRDGKVLFIGNVNTDFGECDCCSSVGYMDIAEYALIEVEV